MRWFLFYVYFELQAHKYWKWFISHRNEKIPEKKCKHMMISEATAYIDFWGTIYRLELVSYEYSRSL